MLKALSLAVATVVIPFACYTPSPASATTPPSYLISQNATTTVNLTRKGIGVGGVKLSMSETQVRQILGKPIQVSNSFLGAVGKTRTLQYSGIIVELGESSKPGSYKVYSIKANGSNYATPNGVKIGDSQSKLIRTYGEKEATRTGGVSRFNYSVTDQDPAILSFTVKNGKIIKIECLEVIS